MDGFAHGLIQLVQSIMLAVVLCHDLDGFLAPLGLERLLEIAVQIFHVPIQGEALGHLCEVVRGVHQLIGCLLHPNVFVRCLRDLGECLGRVIGRKN